MTDISKDSISKIFKMAGIPMPENPTEDAVNKALASIQGVMEKKDISKPVASPTSSIDYSEYLNTSIEGKAKSVLIVDDLGVVTYQLETLFKKIDYQTEVAREVFDALDKYKQKDYDFVVMDLFLTTEREGFLLLDELKKLILLCQLKTKIIVMTASTKEDQRIQCLNRGADYFIPKAPGWQNNIIKICQVFDS